MSCAFNRVATLCIKSLFGALVLSPFVACASASPEAEPEAARAVNAELSCGTTVSDSWPVLNDFHRYPLQSLQVDCLSPGSITSVFVVADDVPNRFAVVDASGTVVAETGWLGTANYSGPWGGSLSNLGSASLSFAVNNAPYFIRVDTLTPPDGTYPHTTDVWSAGVSCQCLRHYACGYAVRGNNCDNGRTHANVAAANMTEAIAACRATQAGYPAYPDFCYVLDRDGSTSSDVAQCIAPASWRPKNSCCNFKGNKSCPL